MQSIKRGPPHTEQRGRLFRSGKMALPRRRTIYLQIFLSPLSFCSTMALAMRTHPRPLERWGVKPKQPWTWEAEALWSCEASELYGKCYFPHPKTGNPKDQRVQRVGACVLRVVMCSLVWGVGGISFFFSAPRPFLSEHYKDSNWPFFYRATVPLNSISCSSSVPKLVFWVGWPHAKPLSGEISGHLFRWAGLETAINCTDTIHSFGWIFNSYKWAGNVQRLGLHGDVDETASGSKQFGNSFGSFYCYFLVIKHESVFLHNSNILACTQSQILKLVKGQLC